MRFGALGTVGRGPRHRRSWWRVGCGCRQGCQDLPGPRYGFMMTSVALLLQGCCVVAKSQTVADHHPGLGSTLVFWSSDRRRFAVGLSLESFKGFLGLGDALCLGLDLLREQKILST